MYEADPAVNPRITRVKGEIMEGEREGGEQIEGGDGNEGPLTDYGPSFPALWM